MNAKTTLVTIALSFTALAMASQPALASDRIVKGALVGGAVGAVAGHGAGDALKGAAIGGGVAAATQHGQRGRDARSGAAKGAVVGAVVGGVAGHGSRDVVKGAALGAAGGAIIGGR